MQVIDDVKQERSDFSKEIEMLEKIRSSQPKPVVDDDTITKRNAAMMLLSYLGQKKQLILLAVLGAALVYLVTAFIGWIGGILSLVVVLIWFAGQFLSNEKETKALKERFVI